MSTGVCGFCGFCGRLFFGGGELREGARRQIRGIRKNRKIRTCRWKPRGAREHNNRPMSPVGRHALVLGILVAAAAAALGGAAWLQKTPWREWLHDHVLRTHSAPGVSQGAPDFELGASDGRRYRLSALRGQVVLVVFWTTWCRYCGQEMYALRGLHERLAGRGFQVLAVNVDSSESRFRDFLENGNEYLSRPRQLPYPLLRDADGDVARLYGNEAIPDNFLIDRDGRLRFHQDGSGGRLFAVIEQLVAESAEVEE
jgi:peroxiredoxin